MYRLIFRLLALCALLLAPGRAAPVEFVFRPAPSATTPLARELWAEVQPPAGAPLLLAAFYRGNGEWAVRARPDAAGAYTFGRVTETGTWGHVAVDATLVSPGQVEVGRPVELAAVTIDPRSQRTFRDSQGRPHYPIGANFPWAPAGQDPDTYYPAALADAQRIGMNWARVWMAHWGRLNLDWRAPEDGASPAPGHLDVAVADRWDRLIETAERHGVRLQVVLQHHGQYSTRVNSNWDINPWSQANGGFLASPVEFFTSERARQYTRQKYRYIVARWGYSPAIFAWELFNEVHWTDARAGDHASNAAVADWHAEMARLIRRVDAYRHLVTTSDDALQHPLYSSMDYYQPHLYGMNMLAGVQRFELDPARIDRPIFYGEVGDDNLFTVPDALKHNGYTNLPIGWAGLMGASPYPAQIWYAHRLVEQGGLAQYAPVIRFAAASGLADRPGAFVPFTPAVSSTSRLPYTVEPGAYWHRMAPPTVHVPLDGRASAQLAKIPRTLVWAEAKPTDANAPFPHELTLLLDYPRDATAVLRLSGASPQGGSIRVALDGRVVGEHRWPAPPPNTQPPATPPQEFVLPMKPGRRTLVLSNPHGPDWVEIGQLATGIEVPVLAATGKRSAEQIALWVYHRAGVWAVDPPPAATALLHLEAVPAGRWRVTWWDAFTGEPAPSQDLEHGGGTLDLPTPPIARFAAVTLQRR